MCVLLYSSHVHTQEHTLATYLSNRKSNYSGEQVSRSVAHLNHEHSSYSEHLGK